MNGKGSSPRPMTVSKEEYDRRWADTFGASAYDAILDGLKDALAFVRDDSTNTRNPDGTPYIGGESGEGAS